MSAFGPKQALLIAPHMSAFRGVKRIWRLHCEMTQSEGKELVLSSTFSATHAASKNRVGVTYDPPPHASTSGMAHRSSKASRHGANAYGFCPPGQAKKPGRGSAFRC